MSLKCCSDLVDCEKLDQPHLHGHDWRVNPHIILTSNPPRRQLVCADCGEIKFGPWGESNSSSTNPKDWERA